MKLLCFPFLSIDWLFTSVSALKNMHIAWQDSHLLNPEITALVELLCVQSSSLGIKINMVNIVVLGCMSIMFIFRFFSWFLYTIAWIKLIVNYYGIKLEGKKTSGVYISLMKSGYESNINHSIAIWKQAWNIGCKVHKTNKSKIFLSGWVLDSMKWFKRLEVKDLLELSGDAMKYVIIEGRGTKDEVAIY